jgi:uncharacterized protein (TIGR02145 family)
MAENLDFGTYIVNGSGTNQTDATATSAEKYCYGNDEANCTTYGGLYQWHTVMALPYTCNSTNTGTAPCIVDTPHQGICPEGWYVPTQAEWTTLKTWVDNNNGGDPDDEGTSLKSLSSLWSSGAGTDAYGWSGLPGGGRFDGSYEYQGEQGNWWSASPYNSTGAWYRFLENQVTTLVESDNMKSLVGYPLRCLKAF